MNKIYKIIAITLLVIGIVILCFENLYLKNARYRAEHEHGIKLPVSAKKIQCRGNAWFGLFDRGATTIFEMNSEELDSFLKQITINSRNGPAKSGPGDPLVNGWNVWPEGSPTFVPGNEVYGSFEKTWLGEVVPLEMLSCDSPTGDWLHIEIWSISNDLILVKMFTEWN